MSTLALRHIDKLINVFGDALLYIDGKNSTDHSYVAKSSDTNGTNAATSSNGNNVVFMSSDRSTEDCSNSVSSLKSDTTSSENDNINRTTTTSDSINRSTNSSEMEAKYDMMQAKYNEMEAKYNNMEAKYNMMEAKYSIMESRYNKINLHFDSETTLFAKNGYTKDKHLCYTRKGEILVANDLNRNSEPVCIKKIKKNRSIDSEFVKNALLTSEVSKYKYFDFFQSEHYLYFVIEMDFGTNIKEFVNQCKIYVENNKLKLKCYRLKIREILWDLVGAIYYLHSQNVTGLDICVENIFMSHSDFIKNKDGSVMINPRINCKLIDFDHEFRNLGMVINEEKKQELSIDKFEKDIYHFGSVCYFCLLFEPVPIQNIIFNNCNLKIYLQMHGQWSEQKSLIFLQDLFNINEQTRLKTVVQVAQHKYFRAFNNS